MTKAKITVARRKRIETLIRKARGMATLCRSSCNVTAARLYDDLGDVAKRYLQKVKP